MSNPFPLFDDFVRFVIERHNIYLRRKAGQEKPWTNDKILQSYRFCNVYRELDTVTKWIRDNWRAPNFHERDVWFAMVVARLVNWPDSLAEFSKNGPVKTWRPNWFVDALNDRAARGEKVYTGAYMVRADAQGYGQRAGKPAYHADCVLTPMWERRAELRPRKDDTLASFHARLMTCKDMGSFMAGQVVCDTKYTASLNLATDWWDWAASGPGSKRGLNRVCGNDNINEKWREEHWLQVLQELRLMLNERLPRHWEKLHAQDVQNCLCEFDKYERVRNGEGRPRALYNGR